MDQKKKDVHPSEENTSTHPIDFEVVQGIIDHGYEEAWLDPEDLRRLKELRRPQHGFKKIWTAEDGSIPK